MKRRKDRKTETYRPKNDERRETFSVFFLFFICPLKLVSSGPSDKVHSTIVTMGFILTAITELFTDMAAILNSSVSNSYIYQSKMATVSPKTSIALLEDATILTVPVTTFLHG